MKQPKIDEIVISEENEENTNDYKDFPPEVTYKAGEALVKKGGKAEGASSLSSPKNKPGPKPIDESLDRALVIKGIKATIRMAKRLKNLVVVLRGYELLGRIEGSLDRNVTKKIELTGKDGGPIEYQDFTIEELKAKLQRSVDRINQAGRVHWSKRGKKLLTATSSAETAS